MADTFVNVNLQPGPGVDARLLFPGSTALKATGAGNSGDGTTAEYFFSDARGNDYQIEYTGKNLSTLSVDGVSQDDVYGDISSATLFRVDGNADEIELASMSVVDANGNPATILMPSAADFTPNSIQNNNHFEESTRLTETGDSGADHLLGSDYNDVLSGYGGRDTLTGGGGNDWFEFISGGTSTYDYVTDFTHGHDKLVLDTDLRNFGSDIHNSNLASVFHDVTNSPEKASDRLIYNHNNGHLSYDPDGSGTKPAQLIAVLTNHAAVTYSDIRVV